MKPPHGSASKQTLSLSNVGILFAVTSSQYPLEEGTFLFFVKNDQFRLNVPGMQYELLVKIAEILIYIPRSYSSAESFWTSIKSHITAPIFIHDCPGGVWYICEFNLVLIQLQCRTRACDHIRVEFAIYVLCGTCVWYMCVVYMCVCGVVHVCDISCSLP